MDHQYIKQIRENKKKSLCVITGVHFLPNGGTIHRDQDMDAKAELKANVSLEIKIFILHFIIHTSFMPCINIHALFLTVK